MCVFWHRWDRTDATTISFNDEKHTEMDKTGLEGKLSPHKVVFIQLPFENNRMQDGEL